MKSTECADRPLFDAYAESYDDALAKGLAVSGEDKQFFACERAKWLERCLARLQFQPRTLLDFGCGTGSATPFLLALPGVESLTGLDVSAEGLRVAERLYGSDQVRFQLTTQFADRGQTDLAFCNGVFHHIPPHERDQALRLVFSALRPDGLFAFWENNPWNPGTRYVMSRIPFDRDAITLSAPQAKHLLRSNGFQILRTDFRFLFPHSLRFLRFVEPLVSRLPCGAQYQILARRPEV
jgi:SAM-dependent methyltransferase